MNVSKVSFVDPVKPFKPEKKKKEILVEVEIDPRSPEVKFMDNWFNK